MAEAIRLSTFHDHQLTDKDHALFMQTVTSQSGLFYGCEVTLKDENTLHISTGEGIACGRIFSIMDMDYPVELSASGDLLGRLYVHIDTALDDTPAQLMDVQGSTLPALIQNDEMNQSTGVYEIELATFSINELGISNLEFTAPKATGGGAGGKSIAPDYSATESYEKGRIFFQNGTLYKTIAAIPAGAPLVVDTNVVETSLAAEIEALNQNLTYRWNPTTDYFEHFINGQWIQDKYAGFNGMYYMKNGVVAEIAGSASAYPYIASGQQGYTAKAVNAEKQGNYMVISDTGGANSGIYAFANPVKCAEISKVKITLSGSKTEGGYTMNANLNFMTPLANGFTTIVQQGDVFGGNATTLSERVIELTLPNTTQEGYIGFALRSYLGTITLNIKDVELVPR